MNENAQNNAPASGDEQMQNRNVVAGSGLETDSRPNHNQAELGTNPAKRVPYNGSKKIARTKADSMATINSCNGQIRRVDLRAEFLIKSHQEAKIANSNAPDFEAKREIVLADQKVVSELSDLKMYKNELGSQKTEILKKEEAEIGDYSFDELSW
jgi:hypothetical protein